MKIGFYAALIALGAVSPAFAKGLKLDIAVPIVVEAAQSGKGPETVGQQEVFGAVPARYRSAIVMSDAMVSLDKKPLPFEIKAGDMLIEAVAKEGADYSKSLYCTLRRVSKNRVYSVCLADTDKDGNLDRLFTGFSGYLKPFLPYPLVEETAEIKPARYVSVKDDAALQLRLGYYVSGNNPLLGEHHFYPVLVQGDEKYPIFEEHRAVSTKSLPKAVAIGSTEIELTGYADKKYTVSVTKPRPAGTLYLRGPIPTRTVWIYVPG